MRVPSHLASSETFCALKVILRVESDFARFMSFGAFYVILRVLCHFARSHISLLVCRSDAFVLRMRTSRHVSVARLPFTT